MPPNIRSNLYQPLDAASEWLYEAALCEASELPVLPVGNTQVAERQLVLIRYTTQLISPGFTSQDEIVHGAMWTNHLTCHAARTADITGANRGANWLGLNVVRLGFREGLDVCDRYDEGPVWVNWAKLGKEYGLRLDVPANCVATIPYEYDEASELFIKKPSYIPPAFNPIGWLPAL